MCPVTHAAPLCRLASLTSHNHPCLCDLVLAPVSPSLCSLPPFNLDNDNINIYGTFACVPGTVLSALRELPSFILVTTLWYSLL